MAKSHENQVLKKTRFVRQIAIGFLALKNDLPGANPCFIKELVRARVLPRFVKVMGTTCYQFCFCLPEVCEIASKKQNW